MRRDEQLDDLDADRRKLLEQWKMARLTAINAKAEVESLKARIELECQEFERLEKINSALAVKLQKAMKVVEAARYASACCEFSQKLVDALKEFDGGGE